MKAGHFPKKLCLVSAAVDLQLGGSFCVNDNSLLQKKISKERQDNLCSFFITVFSRQGLFIKHSG